MASTQRALTAFSPLKEADKAYSAGEYEAVLHLLRGARFSDGSERARSAILQARAALALDRPEEVEPILQRASKEAHEPAEAVVLRMLLGSALTRTDRRDEGEAMLDDAASLAQRTAPQHAGEVGYYRALSRWCTYRLGEAESIVAAALPHAAGYARSRLLQLGGWIDIRRERYAAAGRAFTAALEVLDESSVTDVKGRARILNSLGCIAAETIDLRLGRLTRRAYERTAWSNDTRLERCQILEYLAWLSLLEGNIERAWDERQLALNLTVDTSFHAIALIGTAHLAGIVGDRFAESRYLELAGTLLLRGDQVGLDVERRIAMLSFAAAAPVAKIQTARNILALYERTAPRRTQMLAFEGDRRVDAYERWARGKMALAEGRTSQAIAELQQSLDMWLDLSYDLRAAIAANDLRVATGERSYAQTAFEALRKSPKAWLRTALEQRAADDDPLGRLTRAERRVLAELCTGKKAREIAAVFDRSFNTINNHTRAIFIAFGVRSRATLVAECARRGILDDVKALR